MVIEVCDRPSRMGLFRDLTSIALSIALPLLSTAANVTFSTPPAAAQASTKSGTAQPQAKQPKKWEKPTRLSQQSLDTMPPDVPVPTPTGSKFENGYKVQYKTSRPTTYVTLTIPSDVKSVMEWYKRALPPAGWKLNTKEPSAKSTGGSIQATKPKGYCSIQVSTSVKDAKNSSVTLTYF